MSTQAPAAGLRPTTCAICGDDVPAGEVYPSNFAMDDLNAEIFSARRLPDRVHYRMVRCERCSLVRSDPVADDALLQALYRESGFDYEAEVGCLTVTYMRALEQAARSAGGRGRVLEIGCGNGFVLDAALHAGFRDVRGVEPSSDAVNRAPASVRERIVCDVARAGLFEPGSFDIICLFQVLDHLSHPAEVLDLCHQWLAPGGVLLCFNHNVRAWSARLLGRRSPIVDIEHTYLYSPATMRLLARKCGFATVRCAPVTNYYDLGYLAHLLPLPRVLRRLLQAALRVTRLRSLRLWVPLGNVQLIARKR